MSLAEQNDCRVRASLTSTPTQAPRALVCVGIGCTFLLVAIGVKFKFRATGVEV